MYPYSSPSVAEYMCLTGLSHYVYVVQVCRSFMTMTDVWPVATGILGSTQAFQQHTREKTLSPGGSIFFKGAEFSKRRTVPGCAGAFQPEGTGLSCLGSLLRKMN